MRGRGQRLMVNDGGQEVQCECKKIGFLTLLPNRLCVCNVKCVEFERFWRPQRGQPSQASSVTAGGAREDSREARREARREDLAEARAQRTPRGGGRQGLGLKYSCTPHQGSRVKDQVTGEG